MKIAVFGHPRSGSTKVSVLLSLLYGIEFWEEMLNTTVDVNELTLLVNKINTSTDSFVVKLFEHNFKIIPLSSIQWDNFDLIVITTRGSIVDAYVSSYIAEKRNNWIKRSGAVWETTPFAIDVTQINRSQLIISSYNTLQQSISEIKSLAPHTKIAELTYDEISNNDTLRTVLPDIVHYPAVVNSALYRFAANGPVPTGINYREKCLNYDEVEAKFKELNLI